MAKEGSTISGLMDTLATSVSLALQYGVPLRDVVNKFAHVRFEPSGFTGNPEIPIAKSLVDYIFRWLGSRFLPTDEKGALGLIDRSAVVADAPVAFGASALQPRADEGITAQSEAVSRRPSRPSRRRRPPPRRPMTPPRPRRGPGPRPRRSACRGPEELVAVATQRRGNGATRPRQREADARGLHRIARRSGGPKVAFAAQADAPSCAECGSIMIRNGSCYKCLNCGSTSGCS